MRDNSVAWRGVTGSLRANISLPLAVTAVFARQSLVAIFRYPVFVA
jgi:hypothetical protein